MPRLRYTANSPFARKVRVLTHELGISDSIELVNTALRTNDDALWRDNPLAKVPVWIADDGMCLSDSNVICDYLDELHGQRRFLQQEGRGRWRDLSLISLADGMAEAGMLARQENARPAQERNAARAAQEMAKVTRGLDRLEQELQDDDPTGSIFGLASIAIASSLGWLELRFGADALFSGRSDLARWWEAAASRTSMVQTQPRPEH